MKGSDVSGEVAAATAKIVPSAAVVGATVFGFTIQEVAALFGCAFILMQMIYLAWKWRREARKP